MSRNVIAPLKAFAVVLTAFAPLLAIAGAAMSERFGPPVREIDIVVDRGYQPDKVTVKAGERVRLKFVRKEFASCTRELVIPALQIRKELPPHKPVLVELPALAPGDYGFHCGMNRVRGAITVVAS